MIRRIAHVVWFTVGLAVAYPSLTLVTHAQTVPAYGGRPFIRIAQPGLADSVAGVYSGFGRAQLIGNAVVFATMNGPNVGGIFRGRGGPLEKVVVPGSSVSGVTLQSIHYGFARDTGASSMVLAAGPAQADALQLTDGSTLTTLLPPGSILPHSGEKAANVLGEPFYAQGKVAVIAWHAPASGGVSFRGVYRVQNSTLEPVADTATALPGSVGIPDTFSSQVGFDGGTLAFWASRGPFSEAEGIFVQSAAGDVVKIAQNGDPFPDGGTMDGFISPPFVSNGTVYFFAFDASSQTRLLKYESGTLSVLVQDGTAAPEGGTLKSLGQFGLGVEDSKIFFPALTDRGAGLYVIAGGTLQTIIPSGTGIEGFVPTSLVLQDVAHATLVLEAANGFGRRLIANLDAPAVPVIVSDLTPQTVKPGGRAEFKVTAVGDAPLTYYWTFGTTNYPPVTSGTFVIENAQAAHIGNYRVTVSNAVGRAFSKSALLNVEIAPEIVNTPKNIVLEVGDSLFLQVTALGGLPMAFDWAKDGLPVTSDSPASGAFARTAVSISDAGTYSVTVSNAFGMASASGMVVTVNPAAPNPSFAGKRLAVILDSSTPVPDASAKFDTSSFAETTARWWGDKVIAIGQNAAGEPLGIFSWENGQLIRLLAPDISLSNGLGKADGFSLVPSLATADLAVRGQQLISGFRQPVGLYRYDGSSLTIIADTTFPAPEAQGAKLPIFYGDAFYAGDKTVFIATLDGRPSLYLVQNGALRQLLLGSQDLPVVGTATTQLQSLSGNGTDIFVVAATSSQQQLVALKIDASGGVTKLLAKDEALPGTTGTVRGFGPSASDGQRFYVIVYDSAFAPNVLSWHDGTWTRLAGPGMAVADLGTIQAIESSFPKAVDGKVYFSARVRTATSTVRGVVAAGLEGLRPVLFPAKLDARVVAATYVVDVAPDKLMLLADFLGGGRALYANVGPNADATTLRLEYALRDRSTLQLSIPASAELQAAREVLGPWETILSSEVSILSGHRFFKLRQR